MKQGIRVALELRFGEAVLPMLPEMESIRDGNLLATILELARRGATLEQLRECWKRP